MERFIAALAAAPEGQQTEAWRVHPALTAFLALGLVLFYLMLFFMLKRKQLILKYTLFWLLSSIVLLVFLIFPRLVLAASELVGISNPVNAVFLLFAGVSLMLIMSLTSIVSQLSDKNRSLTQSIALLERRGRDLEDRPKE